MSRWCAAYRGSSVEIADDVAVSVDGDERPRMSLLAYAEAVSIETDADLPF